MSQKRFVFDDELEEDLQSLKNEDKSVKNIEKTPLTNSIDKDIEKKPMGKRKKKRKIKKASKRTAVQKKLCCCFWQKNG